ncbi:hypothetical protein ABE607_12605 [Comamonas aquatica]|uniref:hypothetical protein n=1 Tax=Comamonas aquatica TaxID=225991 RepID=UPI0032079E87
MEKSLIYLFEIYMALKRIALVTVDGFFGQSIPTERSLDVDELSRELTTRGYEVKIVDIEKVCDMVAERTVDYYLFGSHQNPEIKLYINDIVAISSLIEGFNPVPSFPLILAHENKGVQSILNKYEKIGMPEQNYLYREKIIDRDVVVKHVSGAGSSKVFKVFSNQRYFRKLVKSGFDLLTVKDILFYLKSLVKASVKWKNFTKGYIDYNKRYFRHVQQDFINSPGYDFKVLVFFDRCYVLKRGQRPNDFRSSGSGLFEFVNPDLNLIKKSIELRSAINTPYISLDLVYDADSRDYRCIEFQCLHFGPYAMLEAKDCWMLSGGEILRVQPGQNLESEYAYSISNFIK